MDFQTLTKEELLSRVPDDAPQRLKVNWNKPTRRWYYFVSSYSYSAERKRSIEQRTTVGYLDENGKFVYTPHYLLLRQAHAGATSPEVQQTVSEIREQCCQELKDTRKDFLVVYPIDIIFVVAMLASLSGANSAVQIADYWKAHRQFLSSLFNDFPEQDISHDSVRRVLMLHQRKAFEKLFETFVARFVKRIGTRIVNVDGQMVRATKNKTEDKDGRYLVSFHDSDNDITLCQLVVEEKTNEIPTAQAMLENLDLSDCVVTGDAMHTQVKTASLILKQGGNYCLAVKANHEQLRTYLELYFERPGSTIQTHTFTDQAHGREEVRVVSVLAGALLPTSVTKPWPGLEEGTIVRVQAYRREKSSQTEMHAVRYYISSVPWGTPACCLKHAHFVRRHWAIENELHHVLDVNMMQDAIQCKNATYLSNRTCLIKLANNVHSKYRQWLEKNENTTFSKARLLKMLANPENALTALKVAFSQYA